LNVQLCTVGRIFECELYFALKLVRMLFLKKIVEDLVDRINILSRQELWESKKQQLVQITHCGRKVLSIHMTD
jgi:hypothetical protein